MGILFIDNENELLKEYVEDVDTKYHRLVEDESIEKELEFFLKNTATVDVLVVCQFYRFISGADLIRRMRKITPLPYTIVVTEPNAYYEENVAVMKAGASDVFDSSGHVLELIIKIKRADDERKVRENLNRELNYQMEAQMERLIKSLQKEPFLRDEEDYLLPSEVKSIFLTHFKDRFIWKLPHVLVVDDEVKIQELVTSVLFEEFEISTACTGEDAFKFLKENPGKVDIILMDIAMPGKTGEKWIGDFLNIDPNLFIVMITAHREDIKLLTDSIRGGAKDYIGKPVSPNRLLKLCCTLARIKMLQENILKLWDTKRMRHHTKEIEQLY